MFFAFNYIFYPFMRILIQKGGVKMESKITTNAMDLPSSCHSKMDDVMERAIADESYSIADISDSCCSEIQACEQRISA